MIQQQINTFEEIDESGLTDSDSIWIKDAKETLARSRAVLEGGKDQTKGDAQ